MTHHAVQECFQWRVTRLWEGDFIATGDDGGDDDDDDDDGGGGDDDLGGGDDDGGGGGGGDDDDDCGGDDSDGGGDDGDDGADGGLRWWWSSSWRWRRRWWCWQNEINSKDICKLFFHRNYFMTGTPLSISPPIHSSSWWSKAIVSMGLRGS